MTGPPLAATLERASGAGSWGDIRLFGHAGSPAGPGWSTAAELCSDASLLDGLLRRFGRECGTEIPQVTGSLFLKGYLWRVLAPVVAALVLERRVPDLGPEGVALRFDGLGFPADLAVGGAFAALPDDPEAGHPNALVLASEEDLSRYLAERFAGSHLPGLLAALRPRTRRGLFALRQMAVDAVADAFLIVGQALDREEEAVDLAEGVLADPAPLTGPTNYYAVEHDGRRETSRVRNACCLYYRLGRDACLTCPRTTRVEKTDEAPEVRSR
ncbi:IucA/IucC family C-terminal-domain containing protein [Rubrobacter tropicus]|nr:IucA/IucC family C-terminal-domain containing protein [Rubrobacter tropicus]